MKRWRDELKDKEKIKQKRYYLFTEHLLSNNTWNRFKFMMTPTFGKTSGLPCRNGTITLPSRKPRTVDNMPLQPVPSEPYK